MATILLAAAAVACTGPGTPYAPLEIQKSQGTLQISMLPCGWSTPITSFEIEAIDGEARTIKTIYRGHSSSMAVSVPITDLQKSSLSRGQLSVLVHGRDFDFSMPFKLSDVLDGKVILHDRALDADHIGKLSSWCEGTTKA